MYRQNFLFSTKLESLQPSILRIGVFIFRFVWVLVGEKNLGSLLTPVSCLTEGLLTSFFTLLLLTNRSRLRWPQSYVHTCIDILVSCELSINYLTTSDSHLVELSIFEVPWVRTTPSGVWQPSRWRSSGWPKSTTSSLRSRWSQPVPLPFSLVKFYVSLEKQEWIGGSFGMKSDVL